MTQPTATPRERFREQTRGEIKAIATRQLAEGGVGAIALTRIAKELGLTGPALYRYFANRDELLTALILDAYGELAAAIQSAASPDAPTPEARLGRVARAYRSWARDHPHRYQLIFGTPLPGYAAPADTLGRARSALGPLLSIFAAGEPTPDLAPLVAQMTAWVGDDPGVANWVAEYVTDADRAGLALAGAVAAWSRLHGVVWLEVVGQFTGMGHDPGTLLDTEITLLARAYRLPGARRSSPSPSGG